MNDSVYNRLERYHKGQMGVTEKNEFEMEMKNNEALALENERYTIALQAIEAEIAEDLRQQFDQWEEQPVAKRRTLISNIVRYAAAASIAILLVSGTLIGTAVNNVSDKIDSEMFTAHSTETRSLDEAIPSGIALEKADALFEDGSYDEAITMYRDIQLNNPEKMWIESAQFKEVLALYKTEGHSKGFEMLLSQILKNEEHSYYNKAVELSETADGFWYKLSQLF